MKIALLAKTLLTPLVSCRNPIVVIEDGRILAAGSRDEVAVPRDARVEDFGDAVLAPGMIDVHLHGSGGSDIMEATPEALARVGRQLARHGVTSYLPTTVTAPWDATLSALDRLAQVIENPPQQLDGEPCAQPLSLHLEGPFISHRRLGVHPPQHVLEPSLERFDDLWNAARGHVGWITMAPEREGALPVIESATSRGVVVSMGHTDADLAAAQKGREAGAAHVTHTFNAMRPLDHREPGILGLALGDPDLSAEIIADGVHVHPLMVSAFLRLKGPERAMLVTDAISATGMGDGTFRLGSFDVEVKGARCTAEGKLAGSVLTLDHAVRNAMAYTGWDLQRSIRMASYNPARLLGLLPRKGVIEAGADADIVVLSESGEVRRTIVAGRV